PAAFGAHGSRRGRLREGPPHGPRRGAARHWSWPRPSSASARPRWTKRLRLTTRPLPVTQLPTYLSPRRRRSRPPRGGIVGIDVPRQRGLRVAAAPAPVGEVTCPAPAGPGRGQ